MVQKTAKVIFLVNYFHKTIANYVEIEYNTYIIRVLEANMIIDKLENIGQYLPDNEYRDAVIEFLAKGDLAALEVGRYGLCGSAFANVAEYDTKIPDKIALEAHIKYVDFQVIIGGEESAYYAILDGQPVVKPYDEESDYALYGAEDYQTCTVKAGEFALLMPEHLHQFGVRSGECNRVKKVIFKIPVWDK